MSTSIWIVVGSSFGYTGGWMVNAADYARYLRPDHARRAGVCAALGNFTSSRVLQIAGAAAVTAVGVANWSGEDPAASYASLLPGWLGQLTLIAIVIGALSANSVNLYRNFLLVTAYWIGPWLGVVLADRLLWRVPGDNLAILTDRTHRNWAGPIAMTAAGVVSITLFCNQTAYVGLVARAFPGVSDLTFEVGIALAFALYAVLRPRPLRVR